MLCKVVQLLWKLSVAAETSVSAEKITNQYVISVQLIDVFNQTIFNFLFSTFLQLGSYPWKHLVCKFNNTLDSLNSVFCACPDNPTCHLHPSLDKLTALPKAHTIYYYTVEAYGTFDIICVPLEELLFLYLYCWSK